ARTARPAREQARDIVENLLLPGIIWFGCTPCRFASSGTVASSRSASTAIFALNAASNFLRDFVIPRSIGCDRAGHFTPQPMVLNPGSSSVTAISSLARDDDSNVVRAFVNVAPRAQSVHIHVSLAPANLTCRDHCASAVLANLRRRHRRSMLSWTHHS